MEPDIVETTLSEKPLAPRWTRVLMASCLLIYELLAPTGSALREARAAPTATVGVSFTVVTTAPADITDLTAATGGGGDGSLSLTWTEPGDTGFTGTASQYFLHYSTSANINDDTDFAAATPYGGPPIVPGPGGSLRTQVITGLCPGSTYYWALKAQNSGGLTNSWTHNGVTNPNNFAMPQNGGPPAVTNFTATAGNSSVTLNWTPVNICDFDRYRIFKATFTPPTTALPDILVESTSSYLDNAVTNGTTYYYLIQTFDTLGVSSATAVVQAVPTGGVNNNLPAPPGALRGSAVNGLGTVMVTLDWRAVTTNIDGSTLTDPIDYVVMTSNSVPVDSTPWPTVTTTPSTSYTTSVSNASVWYFAVRTRKIPTAGQSPMSMIYRWSPSGDSMITPSDVPSASSYEITIEGNKSLFLENNGTDSDWIPRIITETPISYGSQVATAINAVVRRARDGRDVNNVTYPMTGKLSLFYSVSGGQVIQGQSGLPILPAADAARNLSLFWFNGVSWIQMGGTVDTSQNAVTMDTTRFGKFQIRTSPHLSTPTLIQVYPRIFTPNGDGINDVVVFQFGQVNLSGTGVTGEIFNVRGASIANLRPGPDPSSTLMWDGKDSSGNTVRSGIYIYQIEVNGQKTRGTIVVAR